MKQHQKAPRPLYKATNSRETFGTAGFGMLCGFAIISYAWIDRLAPWLTAVLITAGLLLTGLMFYWSRHVAFRLLFDEQGITQRFTHRPLEKHFEYHELQKIFHRQDHGASMNDLHFEQDGQRTVITVNSVAHGDAYVGFILFLKSKYPHFETHVQPKGTVLHTKLRRALLGTEF